MTTSPNLSEIVTTTLRNRSKKLADNITNNNAILRKLNSKGNVSTFSGGRTIVQELEYAQNSTYKRYSGYEVLDISPSDVFSAAEFNIKQAAVGISISGLEQLQNSGPEAVIDLLASRVKNGERTMNNGITTDMYSDGTASSSKQIGGLQLLVPVAAATGTVGGIDASSFSFWQNIAKTVAAFTTAAGTGNAVTTMQATWVQLVRGNDGPDLIIQDNNHFTTYYSALQAQQRFVSESKAEGGFTSLMFNNVPVILDGGVGTNCPTFTTYMLNTTYLYFRPHSDRNFVPIGDDRFSVNQDAMVKLIGWAGNMTVANRRLQGVISSTS